MRSEVVVGVALGVILELSILLECGWPTTIPLILFSVCSCASYILLFAWGSHDHRRSVLRIWLAVGAVIAVTGLRSWLGSSVLGLPGQAKAVLGALKTASNWGLVMTVMPFVGRIASSVAKGSGDPSPSGSAPVQRPQG